MLSAEAIWWARVRRAAEREGLGGRKLLSDWSHDMVEMLSVGPGHHLELVNGQGWVEIPPERFTDEYKAMESRRLKDELGRRLGVGPMP